MVGKYSLYTSFFPLHTIFIYEGWCFPSCFPSKKGPFFCFAALSSIKHHEETPWKSTNKKTRDKINNTSREKPKKTPQKISTIRSMGRKVYLHTWIVDLYGRCRCSRDIDPHVTSWDRYFRPRKWHEFSWVPFGTKRIVSRSAGRYDSNGWKPLWFTTYI